MCGLTKAAGNRRCSVALPSLSGVLSAVNVGSWWKSVLCLVLCCVLCVVCVLCLQE